MGNIVLTAEGLSVGYGKKIVVDGLDIEVCKGEILTIIGTEKYCFTASAYFRNGKYKRFSSNFHESE